MDCLLKNNIHFPKNLRHIPKPPECLFYEGEMEILKRPLIGVVGSREMSVWVQAWMEQEFFPALREMKIGVVSGGARGVDQWAHQLAMRAEVPTLVVLPSGLNKKYPQKIKCWEGAGKKVAFLSEYEPDTEMRKHHFYGRNRLISGLVEALFIFQSQIKSGTMMTANCALDQGKSVYVLPGSPLMSEMSGNLQLLYDGAQIVRNREDLKLIFESLERKSEN